MQKLLQLKNKQESKSNRNKTGNKETDERPSPSPILDQARATEKRGNQDRTKDRRQQHERKTPAVDQLAGLQEQRRRQELQATVAESGHATGGTLDADGTALVAELRTTHQDQRRELEQVAALAAEFQPSADVVRTDASGQVADDNQLVAFEAFANAVSLVRVPAAQSLVHQTLILRVDEDVSQRAAIFSGQTPGWAANLGRSIAKTIARSGSSSSFIVWLPVVLVCVHRPFMLEQLFNFYIGVLLSSALVVILRHTVKREKPRHGPRRHAAAADATDALERNGFPSGSAALFALAACFVVVNYRFEPTVVCAVGVGVFSTGLADVTLGRHYVLDIVCGWLLGIVVYLFVRIFVWAPYHTCESIIKPIRDALHL